MVEFNGTIIVKDNGTILVEDIKGITYEIIPYTYGIDVPICIEIKSK